MIRALAPLAAALVLFAATVLATACSNSDNGGEDPTVVIDETVVATVPAAGASCEPGFSAVPGDTPGTITSGGAERTYILHIPDGYNGTQAAPVLLVYHGFGFTADFMVGYTRFNEEAPGAVIAYLDATGPLRAWNDDAAPNGADDVAFTSDLLDKLEADLCVDTNRVFAAGYSNGGGMAQRVACNMPERIAAIMTVAATYSDCKADVPWVAFHGIDDPLVPFEGGVNPPERGGGTFLPTRRVISEYARELGCDGLAQISRPAPEVELSTYINCLAGEGQALLYSIIGGGHTWPGSYELPPATVGATNTQIDASTTAWEFFAAVTGLEPNDEDIAPDGTPVAD